MIKKGDVVRISLGSLSIHKKNTEGKIGIVLDNGNRHNQYKVSITNYKILSILSIWLEVIK